jgi:hypothetical protein
LLCRWKLETGSRAESKDGSAHEKGETVLTSLDCGALGKEIGSGYD